MAINKEKELEIIRQAQSEDPQAVDRFLKHWEPRIIQQAKKVAPPIGATYEVSLDDLIQAGRVRLWRDLPKLDLSRGYKHISNSISLRIRCACIDYMREATGWRRKTKTVRLRCLHFSQIKTNDGLNDFDSRYEAMPLEEMAVANDVNQEDVRRSFQYLLRGLDERTRTMLEQYHIDGLFMREIGQLWGLTDSAISHIFANAYRLLRQQRSEAAA